MYRSMIIGLTGAGNYRTIRPVKLTGTLSGFVGWEYVKKPVIAPDIALPTTQWNAGYNDWINEYLSKGCPIEMYESYLSETLEPKSMKQYKLEIT